MGDFGNQVYQGNKVDQGNKGNQGNWGDKQKQKEQNFSAGSGLSKEREPVEGGGLEKTMVGSVEKERKKEVGEYVKEVPVRPEIPKEVERAGVKHTGPSVPIPVKKKKKKKVNLPLTDDQIAAGLHAHVWQSVRWLAVWCVRQLKKMHIAVKEVSGRFVRE